ncbi:MAG: hypothetical protein ACLFNK_04455 [Candidatus Woesearchaeota archaeon]
MMAEEKNTKPEENMSKEEQVGFQKGALSTLAKEREELSRILNIVEQLMQMHVKSLKDLGVDLQSAQERQEKPEDKKEQEKKPIEDILK